MKELFFIIFKDESTFAGGKDHSNSKWLEIPSKEIKLIHYRLPLGDYLSISGFDKYYQMVEVTKDLNGEQAGLVNQEFVYLFCKVEHIVKKYKINCRNNTIEITILNDDTEEIKRLNPIGWK